MTRVRNENGEEQDWHGEDCAVPGLKIGFGKYKGVAFCLLPTRYVEWAESDAHRYRRGRESLDGEHLTHECWARSEHMQLDEEAETLRSRYWAANLLLDEADPQGEAREWLIAIRLRAHMDIIGLSRRIHADDGPPPGWTKSLGKSEP